MYITHQMNAQRARLRPAYKSLATAGGANKVCSALDPDKGTELELTVYTLTVHDGGVNQGLCAESKMYIDDLRVKGGVILGRGWEVHVFFVSAQRCGCAVAPPGAAFCPGCMLFL